MPRAMYCGSRLMPLGLTTSCCSTSGQTPPISTLVSTNRPSAIAGSLIDRVNAPTTKPAAQIAAISIRISWAGSTALTSVYEAPVKVPPRLENSNSYRSYQYCTALRNTNAASSSDSCSVASGVIFRPGPDNRIPPNRYCTPATAIRQIAMMTNSQPSTNWIIGRVNT